MTDSIENPSVSRIKATVPALNHKTRSLSREEKDHYKVQTAGLKQDIEERKKFARWIFCLCCVWIVAVYTILMLQGFGSTTVFSLSEHVLLAAIGSTTANIIGVFLIVARYLFPKK